MELISLWREMAQLRSDVGDSWKWPSPIDCIRFAFQELAEADDELMRMESPEFLRRRDETGNSVDAELGMCVLMLLSYFRTEDEIRFVTRTSLWRAGAMMLSMPSIAMNISFSWALVMNGAGEASGRVLYSIASISEMMGNDQFVDAVLLAIAKVRARVEEKRSPAYQYLKGGAVECPHCGDPDHMDTIDTTTDEMYHNRKMQCWTCNRQWLDVYKLVSVEL